MRDNQWRGGYSMAQSRVFNESCLSLTWKSMELFWLPLKTFNDSQLIFNLKIAFSAYKRLMSWTFNKNILTGILNISYPIQNALTVNYLKYWIGKTLRFPSIWWYTSDEHCSVVIRKSILKFHHNISLIETLKVKWVNPHWKKKKCRVLAHGYR